MIYVFFSFRHLHSSNTVLFSLKSKIPRSFLKAWVLSLREKQIHLVIVDPQNRIGSALNQEEGEITVVGSREEAQGLIQKKKLSLSPIIFGHESSLKPWKKLIHSKNPFYFVDFIQLQQQGKLIIQSITENGFFSNAFSKPGIHTVEQTLNQIRLFLIQA